MLDFMKYNIDFELFGAFIITVIIVYFKQKYIGDSDNEKCFFKMAISVLIAQIMDLSTGITISIGGPDMALFNLIFTTCYFGTALYSVIFFIEYISTFAHKVYIKKYHILLNIVGIIYFVILFINAFFGYYFSFDFSTGEYSHGPAYHVLYAVPALFMLISLFLILKYRKHFDRRQFISALSFIFFVFLGLFLQVFIMPEVYITYGLVTISFVMIVFSLETPDYQKLMKTLKELELARKEAEDAREEAQAANRVKGDFLAHMSHEIRTPINAILGFDEVILRESEDPDITQYASNIKRGGQTLLALINDILDFSKIESGKMEIITASYDVADMFSDLLLMISPRAEAKGITIRCELDRNLPSKLLGDDVRIRQVIINLLTNAVKYTENGEVTLRASLLEKGKYAKILFSVRDTGIGIREEDQEQLFNAFQRVDESRNRNIEGSGLGLTITSRLLDLMNSKLILKSEYGKGSEFSFILEQEVIDPTALGEFNPDRASGRNAADITREGFTAPEARILVVDDVDMNLKLFRHLLKNTKMTIDTASDGEQALEKIKSNDYDMVFMDHLMPEMDGIETMKKGIEEGIINIRRLPVVALTANAISGARDMYLAEGFTDYLSKPIEVKELEATLLRFLPEDKIQPLAE